MLVLFSCIRFFSGTLLNTISVYWYFPWYISYNWVNKKTEYLDIFLNYDSSAAKNSIETWISGLASSRYTRLSVIVEDGDAVALMTRKRTSPRASLRKKLWFKFGENSFRLWPPSLLLLSRSINLLSPSLLFHSFIHISWVHDRSAHFAFKDCTSKSALPAPLDGNIMHN